MDKYFIGQGRVLAAIRGLDGKPQGFSLLGNCTALSLRLGKAASRYAVHGDEALDPFVESGDAPGFSLTLESLARDNLARALHGGSTVVSAGSVTGEPITAYSGKTVALSSINLTAFTSLTSADGATVYTRGRDYEVDLKSGGVDILAAGAIVDKASLLATYDHDAYEKIGAYTTAPPFLWLRFHGLNQANGLKPMVVDIFKTTLPPIDELVLIGDNLSPLELNGQIHYDATQPDTATDSRFVRIQQA